MLGLNSCAFVVVQIRPEIGPAWWLDRILATASGDYAGAGDAGQLAQIKYGDDPGEHWCPLVQPCRCVYGVREVLSGLLCVVYKKGGASSNRT